MPDSDKLCHHYQPVSACVCVLGGVETQRGGSRYFLSQILGWDAAGIWCLKLTVWYRVLALGPPLNLPKGQKWSMIFSCKSNSCNPNIPGRGGKKTASAIIRRRRYDKPLPNLKMCLAPLLPLPRDSFHKCNSKESKGLHRKREERKKKASITLRLYQIHLPSSIIWDILLILSFQVRLFAFFLLFFFF